MFHLLLFLGCFSHQRKQLAEWGENPKYRTKSTNNKTNLDRSQAVHEREGRERVAGEWDNGKV